MELTFGFAAELWEWEGDAAWCFVTLPADDAEDIRELVPETRGFGSVRVAVEVGDTEWRTSIFPDKTLGSYVLPVKKAVRQAEDIEIGDVIDVTVRVLED